MKLSIIGCGNVAKTIAYLLYEAGTVEILDILNRTQKSAKSAVSFIGAGTVVSSYESLRPANIFVIGCNDDQISHCVEKLINQQIIESDTVIFHFSGAKSSIVLNDVKNYGGNCASLHPIKSFADPKEAIQTFTGTYCGLEGDKKACKILTELISRIGGLCFPVESDKKLIYHAASVFSCNYLVALQELSLSAFEYSGINRDLGMKILEPIVKETSKNLFQMGPSKALTGPISRGDSELVNDQLLAVKEWDNDAAEIYRLMGKLCVKLSKENDSDKKQADLALIKRLLE